VASNGGGQPAKAAASAAAAIGYHLQSANGGWRIMAASAINIRSLIS